MTRLPLIAAMLVCLTGQAHAQEIQDRTDRLVNQIKRQHDANEDGVIEKSEAKNLLLKNFDRVDRNRDGKIDRSELEKLANQLSMDSRKNRDRDETPGVPETVEFKTDIAYRNGHPSWKLDLAMPKQQSEKPRPAIVFVHGGGWRGGDKGGGVWRSYPIEFAKRGYVCISVNYRLSQAAPFPACLEDCKCCVRWLRANAKKYNVDPDRIGAYGNSAGAHLVSMLALVGKEEKLEGDGPHLDYSSEIHAVVPSATPADFTVWAKENLSRPGGLLAGKTETLDERATRASPVTYAASDAPPFLIIHGTADRTVPIDQGNRLSEALKKAGAKAVTYKVYDGAGHGVFRQHENETMPMMIEFFERHLLGE